MPLLPEDFPKWRVKQLKVAMAERLLSGKGCVEKKDFVKKLSKWQKKKQKEIAAKAESGSTKATIEVGADGSTKANFDDWTIAQLHGVMAVCSAQTVHKHTHTDRERERERER